MERIGIIYKWTNKINGKSYIGQTINEEGRKKDHIRGKFNSIIHRAIKKYGLENFNYEVLEQIEESKLSEREIYWIKYFDTYNNGYNLTEGGEGTRGFSHGFTEEQKKRKYLNHIKVKFLGIKENMEYIQKKPGKKFLKLQKNINILMKLKKKYLKN